MAHDLFDNWRRFYGIAVSGLPCLTLTKMANVIRCESEKWRRIVRPRALPYVAVVDVANVCKLKCPYCPTGARRPNDRAERIIDPVLVRKLLDKYDKSPHRRGMIIASY